MTLSSVGNTSSLEVVCVTTNSFSDTDYFENDMLFFLKNSDCSAGIIRNTYTCKSVSKALLYEQYST